MVMFYTRLVWNKAYKRLVGYVRCNVKNAICLPQLSIKHLRRFFRAGIFDSFWKWCLLSGTTWTKASGAMPMVSKCPLSTRSLTPSPASTSKTVLRYCIVNSNQPCTYTSCVRFSIETSVFCTTWLPFLSRSTLKSAWFMRICTTFQKPPKSSKH